MLIVANATGKLGRILVAIEMDGNKPVKDRDGNNVWKRLVVDFKTLAMPTGLVVDLIPGDLITVDVISTKKAVSQVDPYSIRFHSCRTFPEMANILHEQRELTIAGENGNGYCVSLFEAQGFSPDRCEFDDYAAKVIDPWFLEGIKYNPHWGLKSDRLVIVDQHGILSVIHENQ